METLLLPRRKTVQILRQHVPPPPSTPHHPPSHPRDLGVARDFLMPRFMTLTDQLAACFPALTVDINFNKLISNILGRSLEVLSSEMDLAERSLI
jgi:hypothetical protein